MRNCVYVLECKGLYKIGRTGNFPDRLKQLRTSNPFDFQVAHLIYTNDNTKVEEALHLIFAESRVNGEWFNLSVREIAQIRSMSIQAILTLGASLKPKPEKDGPYIDPNQTTFSW